MNSAQGGWKTQRVALEATRTALKQRLAKLGVTDPSRARGAGSEASSLVASLDELEHALGKLRDGTYGRCEQCQRPIAAERLEAVPDARCCLSCAGRAQAGEDATTEYEVDGATQLGIPAFAAEDDAEAHTVQLKVPDHLKDGG